MSVYVQCGVLQVRWVNMHPIEEDILGDLGAANVGMVNECELEGGQVASLSLLLPHPEEHGWIATVGLLQMIGCQC